MKTFAGIAAAGMFSVELKGPGIIAVLTKGDPMTLPVTPGNPVFTDRLATVAWSGNVDQSTHTNICLVGRSSGDSFQLKFECKTGNPGFVVIQPSEKEDDDGGNNSSLAVLDKTVSVVELGMNMAGVPA